MVAMFGSSLPLLSQNTCVHMFGLCWLRSHVNPAKVVSATRVPYYLADVADQRDILLYKVLGDLFGEPNPNRVSDGDPSGIRKRQVP